MSYLAKECKLQSTDPRQVVLIIFGYDLLKASEIFVISFLFFPFKQHPAPSWRFWEKSGSSLSHSDVLEWREEGGRVCTPELGAGF